MGGRPGDGRRRGRNEAHLARRTRAKAVPALERRTIRVIIFQLYRLKCVRRIKVQLRKKCVRTESL